MTDPDRPAPEMPDAAFGASLALPRAMRITWRRDPLTRRILTAFIVHLSLLAAASSFFSGPGIDGLLLLSRILILVLILLALERGAWVRERPERRFWTSLSIAYTIAWCGALLRRQTFFEAAPIGLLILDAMFWLALTAALEPRPEPGGLRRNASSTPPQYPIAGAVLAAVLGDLFLWPAFAGRPPRISTQETAHLLIALAIMFWAFARSQFGETLRRRRIDTLLAYAVALIMLSVLFGARPSPTTPLAEALLTTAFVVLAWAARLRHGALSEEPEALPVGRPFRRVTTPIGDTVLAMYSLPLLHLAGTLIWPELAASRTIRTTMLLAWMSLLAVFILRQTTWLGRFHRTLESRQRLFAGVLHNSENDLRLILSKNQRAKAPADASLAEEDFENIFHRAPEAMAIATLPLGRVGAVNRLWEHLAGKSADELVGRRLEKLGLWPQNSDHPSPLLRRIFDHGRIHDVFADLELHSGLDPRRRTLWWSFTTLDFEHQPCVLIALLDMTGRDLATAAEKLPGEGPLDRARAAIRRLDREGVVASWFAGSQRLYGWTELEALARNSEQLLSRRDLSANLAECRDRDGRRHRVRTSRISLFDASGRPDGALIFDLPISPSARGAVDKNDPVD